MLTRKYEYWLLDPHGEDELPTGIVEYTLFKEPVGRNQVWGGIVYDKPLTADEVERFNLDGPYNVWM